MGYAGDNQPRMQSSIDMDQGSGGMGHGGMGHGSGGMDHMSGGMDHMSGGMGQGVDQSDGTVNLLLGLTQMLR